MEVELKKVMRSLAFLTGGVVLTFPNAAVHAAPNSLNMTCAQAKAYIAHNGSAVLATGNASASFSSEYCSSQEPAFVCTKDVRFCNVGVYCDYNYFINPPAYMQGTDLCRAKE
jgi:hypothetical protein